MVLAFVVVIFLMLINSTFFLIRTRWQGFQTHHSHIFKWDTAISLILTTLFVFIGFQVFGSILKVIISLFAVFLIECIIWIIGYSFKREEEQANG